jgi:hypothetical protein
VYGENVGISTDSANYPITQNRRYGELINIDKWQIRGRKVAEKRQIFGRKKADYFASDML